MEWVAPVATATVGLAGIAFAWLTGKQSRDSAERVARDVWAREKRADAYVRVLEVSEQVGNWAQTVRPMIDTIPPADPSPPPAYTDQLSMNARLALYGSDDVRGAWTSWFTAFDAVRGTDLVIGVMKVTESRMGQPGIESLELWNKMERELRPAEKVARLALVEAVRLEMTPS